MAYQIIAPGKFKRVERIAQGNFGTVYKALRYTGLLGMKQEVVAAKQVSKADGQQEVEFLSKLEHPNIVKFFGVVDDGVDFYIVLELCDGGSLRSYLNRNRARGQRLGVRFFDWAKQAGRPIGFLKTKGVTHKDIKSPNYLITNGSILKLCDFGLAKKIDITMSSATETASYPWMAPELLRKNILSPSYDIYVFGVVVWELLTTDIPFEDCQVAANLAWRICHDNERPPIAADCPKPIADLLQQCWQVDWKKRPSMDEVLSKLESAEQEFPQVQKTFTAGPWKLESEFGHQIGPGKLRSVIDIAVCPNGNIAVLDNQVSRVCVYSNETAYKFSLDLKQGMNPGMTSWPWNVTVNAEGIFHVTCECYVLMYTALGVYKGRWVAMSPNNQPSDTEDTRLGGLTIDTGTNCHLLVGQVNSPCRYISKHRQDGTHIASIKVNIRPWYLAATSHDTIVISDAWRSNTVQIVDSTGHVLHTLNANSQVSFWGPCGVCCHNDIILVCNYNHHEISCFSVSADYLGSIPVREAPLSVTFANNSKLLVACKDKVLIYKHKALS